MAPDPFPAVLRRPDLGDFAWATRLRASAARATPPRRRDHPHPQRGAQRRRRDPLAALGRPRPRRRHGERPTGPSRSPRRSAPRSRTIEHTASSSPPATGRSRTSTPTGSWSSTPTSASPRQLARILDEVSAPIEADVVEIACELWISGRHVRNSGWGNHWHNRFFRAGHVRWSDRIHCMPEVTGRVLRVPVGEGTCLVHFSYDDLHHFVEKLNRYTGKEADALEGEPTSDWPWLARFLRREFSWHYTPDEDGPISGSLAFSMLYYRFLSHAKRWERLGFPDVDLPSDPRVALRDLAHDGRILHAAGIEAFEAGDAAGATDLVRRSVAEQLDVDHLNDLAVLMAQTGRADEARVAAPDLPDPRPRARGRAREPRRRLGARRPRPPRERSPRIVMTSFGFRDAGRRHDRAAHVAYELVRRGWDVTVFYAGAGRAAPAAATSSSTSEDEGVRLVGVFNRAHGLLDLGHPHREIDDPPITRGVRGRARSRAARRRPLPQPAQPRRGAARRGRPRAGIRAFLPPTTTGSSDPRGYLLTEQLELVPRARRPRRAAPRAPARATRRLRVAPARAARPRSAAPSTALLAPVRGRAAHARRRRLSRGDDRRPPAGDARRRGRSGSALGRDRAPGRAPGPAARSRSASSARSIRTRAPSCSSTPPSSPTPTSASAIHGEVPGAVRRAASRALDARGVVELHGAFAHDDLPELPRAASTWP